MSSQLLAWTSISLICNGWIQFAKVLYMLCLFLGSSMTYNSTSILSNKKSSSSHTKTTMRRYVDTYKTRQMEERDAVAEGKTQICYDGSSRIPRTHYALHSKEKSRQVKTTEIPLQRRLNDDYDKGISSHINGSNKAVHVQTPHVSHINERHIPNYSIVGVQPKVVDVNNNANPIYKPQYNLSNDNELDNEIFSYELSLGNEKWEDVLPQLTKSPFASHSRLLYPAPLLCDVTRNFKKRPSGKQSS